MTKRLSEVLGQLQSDSISYAEAKSGRKNYAINGGFDIWQRGTSFSSGGYSADRWVVSFGGGGGVGSASELVGATGVPNKYRMQMTTGGTWESFLQRIEDDNLTRLQGKEVTVSFKCDSNIAMTGRVQFDTYYGSGGSATEFVSVDFAVTATVGQTVSLTMTLPSTVGKTVGAGAYTACIIYPSKDSVTTYIFDAWDVQIEEGSVATDFEQRSIGEELALCQRYYSAGKMRGPVAMYGVSGFGPTVQFPAECRAIPTVAMVNVQLRPTGGSPDVTPTSLGANTTSTTSFGAFYTAPSSYTDENGYCTFTWAADAEL